MGPYLAGPRRGLPSDVRVWAEGPGGPRDQGEVLRGTEKLVKGGGGLTLQYSQLSLSGEFMHIIFRLTFALQSSLFLFLLPK